MFDIWMRLLQQVPGSVLWLLQANSDAVQHLQQEALRRHVDARRLVFAPRMSLDQHLARYRLADLFLDTLPCNAHTTASDALWAGLPVLTCLGPTFAGRVAASLLRAAELPELVTYDEAAYKSLALALATTEADQLTALRQRLANRRDHCALFDTELSCLHLESAYRIMAQRQRMDLASAGFAVESVKLGHS